MPLYEYQCKKCRHIFEKIQQFSDKPVKKCPECGGPVEKLLSAPAVQFKGSGWYVTDYARKNDGGSSSKAAKDSGGDDSSAAKPTEKAATTSTSEDKSDSKKTKPGKTKR
jgi:putative FmdB family regulatory protein